jgi:hypothetical protein
MATTWFMAVLVRGSMVDGELDEDRMGDMLYRLVSAADAEGAYARALEIGAAATETYTDDDGTVVSLEFLGLADLTEIGPLELQDGAEVYGQLIPKKPSGMVAQKEELTVFESALEVEDDDSGEDRFAKQ